jgi:hypothetical protein
MTTEARRAEVGAVDAFLAAPKFLDGPAPTWVNSTWGGECSAVWNVLDADGAPVGSVKFTARKTDTSVCGVTVMHRGRPAWRLDMDHDTVCHPNFHDAHLYGLPPLVCGPHSHAWDHNRDYILGQEGWSLPYRAPLDPAITRLGQGLLWLAGQINLTISPDQRGFDGPTRGDLFDLGGR